LEDSSNRLIYLCIEPEPGCVLSRSEDIVRFYQQYLLSEPQEKRIRRYIRVCHDICHAAVMFEDQADVLNRYRSAGIRVGKLQVSSAVLCPLAEVESERRAAALAQLRGFAEDRYLHQTVVRDATTERELFFDDLPTAIHWLERQPDVAAQARVHFHLPIYLDRFGLLQTTQSEITACWQAIRDEDGVRHLEVETYAWSVLPPELQQLELSAGIARELDWFAERYLRQ
jgi:hypothetical protein